MRRVCVQLMRRACGGAWLGREPTRSEDEDVFAGPARPCENPTPLAYVMDITEGDTTTRADGGLVYESGSKRVFEGWDMA